MSTGDSEFDWDFLMRFGLGALGLAPRDFWRMTPREFDAAARGRMGDIENRAAMGPNEFTALAARFPDRTDAS